MFESKIDPDDLSIILDGWAEASRRISWKPEEGEEIQAIKARLDRLENAIHGLVLALSGTRLPY